MKKNLNQQSMAILVFARLNSRRLAKKVFSKIGDKPLLLFIIERIQNNSNFILPLIVTTSKNKSDDKIYRFCKDNKIKVFRGDLNNVFKRSKDCFIKYKLKSFIRVCADRPFFDVKLMDRMINKFINSDFDIITNQFPRTFPKGLSCEVSKTQIFLNINDKKLTKSKKEHIFNYFYNNSKNYKILNFKLKKNIKKASNLDFSVNNKNDLTKINKLYYKYKNRKYIDILNTL